ncbi:MAG: hypothetical protein AB7E55_19115 [Pigmentiphaga sp.]
MPEANRSQPRENSSANQNEASATRGQAEQQYDPQRPKALKETTDVHIEEQAQKREDAKRQANSADD